MRYRGGVICRTIDYHTSIGGISMICRERKEDWLMVTQHDHGVLAGQFAKVFNSTSFRSSKRWNEAIFAVTEHDRGWIDLDDMPFWNDAQSAPYTFLDFPIAPKLAFYSKGLDEIESTSPYATLLCSMHYEKLLNQVDLEHPTLTKYMQHEQKRRDQIQLGLGIADLAAEGELIYDLHVLQFCDDLSLYLCLNEPGSDKEHEHPWFRDGFAVSEKFDFTEGEMIQGFWKDQSTVELTNFPFDTAFSIQLPSRYVSKLDIQQMGIAKAFSNSEEIRYSIQIQSR